jgi:hypothetical protein
MEVTQGQAQNWCLDPFGTHEERWFSRGIPTALVRDRGVEAQDPPPESAFAHRYSVLAYVDPSAGTSTATVTRHRPGHRLTHRHRDVAARS